MKKHLFVIFIVISTICILSSCIFDDGHYDGIYREVETDIKVSAKYAGAVENENPTAYLSKDCTIKALDVPDYTFWYWEKDGEKISEDAEYTFTVESSGVYYAIYKPKSEDEVLINVICKDAPNSIYILSDIKINGGGYYKKGDKVSLFSDDERAICTSFNVNGVNSYDGPQLDFTAEENITVSAEFNKYCEIIIEENPIYKITSSTGKQISAPEELVEFSYEILDDRYLAAEWVITEKYYTDSDSDKTQSTYTSYCQQPDTSIKTSILKGTRSVTVSLNCTDENIIDTYPITVNSSDGSGATFITPSKIATVDGSGSYQLLITPNEDSYIKNVFLISESTKSFVEITGSHAYDIDNVDYDSTAVYTVSTFEEDAVLRIDTIKKENAAVVRIISNDGYIKSNPFLSEEAYPTISPTTMIVEKGKDYFYETYRYKNLETIYRHGYQFSSITDEDGNFVSERMSFVFSVEKDTNYYINYEKQGIFRSNYDNKPLEEFYFDFHLLPDESGYEVRLSPLTDALYPERLIEFAEVLTIPSTYCGKPVTKIGDYGLSLYRRGGDENIYNMPAVFYEIHVPSTVKYIGEKAFASWENTKVVLDKDISLEYVASDAFWSPNDNIEVILSN